MNSHWRTFVQTIRSAPSLAGRASGAEYLTYLVIAQVLFMPVAWMSGWLAASKVESGIRLAVLILLLLPAVSLTGRRLHDLGLSARWGYILLAVVIRALTLDLLGLVGGWPARAAVESVLSWIDWPLFYLATALYVALIAVPGAKGGNRFGPAPGDGPAGSKTAGPDVPEPAA